ncbi:hypothetical protein C8R43DRAFT_955776 [Mycena crocata]|nr:hypothetical protein C8R43DRAFT_955776 [Mycena crocata]
MAELGHPDGKANQGLCLCRSHDCKNQNWMAKDGTIQKGKWYNRNTVTKHYKEDREAEAKNLLPPVALNTAPAVVATAAVPEQRDTLPASERVASLKDRLEGETTPALARRRLVFIACTLVAWLHLVCGLSRDASHRVLKVLRVIISMVAGNGDSTIPTDVRTAMKRLSLEPVINRTICCPTCYRSYSLEELPQICLSRESSGSKACSTPLWVEPVCLNLPYHLWHLEENTFFVGITPPPKEPTVTTMTALQDPVIEQFQEMWHGKKIPTHNHPDGDFYRITILVAIGDILALKKALGFAGHRSNNFCSFCKLQRDDIDRLDHMNFEPRSGAEILHWAKAWLLASTKAERKAIFKEHGCRWASPNTLTYRDPVKHAVLGLMHNWLEGILQHHCRLKWGIGTDKKKKAGLPGGDEADGSSSDSDIEMFDVDSDALMTELEQLQHDSVAQQDVPASLRRSRSESFVFIQESEDAAAIDIEPDNAEEEDEDYQDDDEEIYASEKSAQKVFDSDSMAKIHAGLANVVIPSWIDRPPVNLGEKSHGKLKADNWLVLFTIFFPLIIPELWYQPSSSAKDKKLLDNFHNLIAATNILCSYAITPAEADTYTEHYIDYLQSSRSLFPDLTTRPNHHYAMHNAAQMKWWGPLPLLGEFMYESHNGSLQKIKTNNHMWELDLTMLRQICRRGRLLASIRDSASTAKANSVVAQVMNILSPQNSAGETAQHTDELAPADVDHNGPGVLLDQAIYEQILGYWNQFQAPPYIRATDLTWDLIDTDANVFPTRAVCLGHFEYKTRLYSVFNKHHGNSSISFLRPSTSRKEMGFIQAIWTMSLQGEIHTFIVVQPHVALSAADEARTPYLSHPKFRCTVKYSKPRAEVEVWLYPNRRSIATRLVRQINIHANRLLPADLRSPGPQLSSGNHVLWTGMRTYNVLRKTQSHADERSAPFRESIVLDPSKKRLPRVHKSSDERTRQRAAPDKRGDIRVSDWRTGMRLRSASWPGGHQFEHHSVEDLTAAKSTTGRVEKLCVVFYGVQGYLIRNGSSAKRCICAISQKVELSADPSDEGRKLAARSAREQQRKNKVALATLSKFDFPETTQTPNGGLSLYFNHSSPKCLVISTSIAHCTASRITIKNGAMNNQPDIDALMAANAELNARMANIRLDYDRQLEHFKASLEGQFTAAVNANQAAAHAENQRLREELADAARLFNAGKSATPQPDSGMGDPARHHAPTRDPRTRPPSLSTPTKDPRTRPQATPSPGVQTRSGAKQPSPAPDPPHTSRASSSGTKPSQNTRAPPPSSSATPPRRSSGQHNSSAPPSHTKKQGKAGSAKTKNPQAQYQMLITEIAPDGRTFKSAFHYHIRFAWRCLESNRAPESAAPNVVAAFDLRFNGRTVTDLQRMGRIGANLIDPSSVQTDMYKVGISAREAILSKNKIISNFYKLEESALLHLQAYLAKLGIYVWAPDFTQTPYSMYNNAMRMCAIDTFRFLVAGTHYDFLRPNTKLVKDSSLLQRMYDHLIHHWMYEKWKAEIRTPGANQTTSDRNTATQARRRVHTSRVKYMEGAAPPNGVPLLLSVKATSDDEDNRVLARPERSAAADAVIRKVEELMIQDLAESGNTRAANARRRRVADTFGARKPSRFFEIPKGMPIQYYDPDWFNNRPPHARASLAPKLIVAFTPNSSDFFSRKDDNGLSVEALTAKYGAQVFGQYDLDYAPAAKGDGEHEKQDTGANDEEPSATANSDDSGDSVGTHDSDGESIADDESMGSFLTDDGEEDGEERVSSGSEAEVTGRSTGDGAVGSEFDDDSHNMAAFAAAYDIPMEEDLDDETLIFGKPGDTLSDSDS